ncbi:MULTISPECIES: stressosome-associated protein Prli42 [Salinicoccus]|uniref:Stressosome-associated protein Prli42 n=1 Tax=Salinicoccus siamensis TaxID=381830 RepID=A0ABV5Z1E0_9STAP
MQNKKMQRVVIWFMIFLIVISGVLFGISMLTAI